MSALRYHLKLQATAGSLTVLALPVIVSVFANPQVGQRVFAQLFWPLAAPILMATLFSREWEGGTAEVLLARPVSRGSLLAGRTAVALGLLLSTCLVGWVTTIVMGQSVPLWELIRLTLPGALALGSAGLAVGTATRASAAGYLVPLTWWLFDWMTAGRYTGRFFLFSGLTEHKGYLLGLAATFLLLTYLLLNRKDR